MQSPYVIATTCDLSTRAAWRSISGLLSELSIILLLLLTCICKTLFWKEIDNRMLILFMHYYCTDTLNPGH